MKTKRTARRRGKARGETAAEAYAKTRGDNAALLDLIDQELAVHEKRAAADPGSWNRTGDLGHVRELLMQVLVFLMNAEDEAEARRAIEAHLAEMRG